MNRLNIHSLFMLVAIALICYALWQFQALQVQKSLVNMLDDIPLEISADEPMPKAVSASAPAQLVWANRLAQSGELSSAEAIFNELIHADPESELAQTAEFNLGNAYLRAGTDVSFSGNRKRALLGLAKQRYRDLLQRTPDDWDIRYNLERALRLAPEIAGLRDAKGPPIKSVDVVVPDFMLKALP